MKTISRALVLVGPFALGLGLTLCNIGTQPALAQTSRPAEEVFKNIQVLKGVTEAQFRPTMEFFSASLGVQCRYCHEEEADRRAEDTKPQKLMARRMIQMTAAINKANFGGRNVITCHSCHRGNPKPVGVPFVGLAAPEAQAAAPEASAGAGPSPTVDQLVEKYVAALGGMDAIQKLSSRVAKGTLTETNPRLDAAGKTTPIEVVAKAPDSRMVITHNKEGDAITALNGNTGWVRGLNGAARDMRREEVEFAQFEDPLSLAVRLKQAFNELRVEPRTEKIGGREAYVVAGRAQTTPSVKLYFDRESGMLVRLVYSTETAAGPFVSQVDYEDYCNAGGVRTPCRWVISQIRGVRFLYQVSDLQANVSVDAAKFAKPSGASRQGAAQ